MSSVNFGLLSCGADFGTSRSVEDVKFNYQKALQALVQEDAGDGF